MNQKRLSEVIHGKKYLGGKQKKQKAAGMKSDPEVTDEEEDEDEQEEVAGAEAKSRKRKRTDDDDNDFT